MGQRIIFIEINNAYWWGWLVHVNLGGELNAGSRSRIIDRSEVTSRRDDAIGIEQIHPSHDASNHAIMRLDSHRYVLLGDS